MYKKQILQLFDEGRMPDELIGRFPVKRSTIRRYFREWLKSKGKPPMVYAPKISVYEDLNFTNNNRINNGEKKLDVIDLFFDELFMESCGMVTPRMVYKILLDGHKELSEIKISVKELKAMKHEEMLDDKLWRMEQRWQNEYNFLRWKVELLIFAFKEKGGICT